MSNVDLEVYFDAPVEQVYLAWHDPESLIHWFAPGDLKVAQAMANFAVNGRLRIVIQTPEFQDIVILGEYLQIEANQRLRFSCQVEGIPEVGEVDVTFQRVAQSTCKLHLLHSGIQDPEMLQDQQDSWINCLEKLSMLLRNQKA